MSGNQMAFPPTIADVPASAAKSGYMQRWHAGDATHGPFAVTAKGMAGRLYVPLATAALAGALSPAQFTLLAGLQVPVARLAYNEATDVLNAAAIAANTQTQVIANQTFAVTSTTALLLLTVRIAVSVTGVNLTNWGLRANIDGGGVTAKLSGAIHVVNGFDSLTGGVVLVAGLAAGNHTIKLELIASAAGQAYCRCNTAPNFEFASIQIEEFAP